MTTSVGFEAASEYLRLALPLMSRYRIPVVPPNYAVWFEFVSGGSAALAEVLSRRMENGERIDEDYTRELYRRYIDPADQSRVGAAERTIRRMLESIGESLSSAEAEIGQFDDTLTSCAAELARHDAAGTLGDIVRTLMAGTERMTAGNAALHRHLEKTRDEANALAAELRQARMEARTDALTGLANRRALDERMRHLEADPEFARHRHSLLLGDIDNFKAVNDAHGHLFGDKVIRVVAQALVELIKGKDLAVRYGGEEFVVLLPEADLAAAVAVAESIRARIERGRVFNARTGAAVDRITVSFGATELVAGESLEAAIARADEALLRAKAHGRNRVETALLPADVRAVAG